MKIPRSLLFTILLSITTAAPAERASITLTEGDGHITIKALSTVVATYVWNDPVITRPYFSNICAPDGTPVTRTYPPDPVRDKGNDDHATFHPGTWMAFGDLNGSDNWRLKAPVLHGDFKVIPSLPSEASFAVTNYYQSTDTPPRTIAKEYTQYSFIFDGDGYYLIAWTSFTPLESTLVFGDQEEMGFGVRVATGLSVKRGGTLLNSEGGRNEAGSWGKTARWSAAYGPADDGKTAGVVLMPGPGNFRPSWFHNRDYGLMVANPFGKKAMTGANDPNVAPDKTSVPNGSMLRFSAGLYVFARPGKEPANPEEKYARFVELLKRLKE